MAQPETAVGRIVVRMARHALGVLGVVLLTNCSSEPDVAQGVQLVVGAGG